MIVHRNPNSPHHIHISHGFQETLYFQRGVNLIDLELNNHWWFRAVRANHKSRHGHGQLLNLLLWLRTGQMLTKNISLPKPQRIITMIELSEGVGTLYQRVRVRKPQLGPTVVQADPNWNFGLIWICNKELELLGLEEFGGVVFSVESVTAQPIFEWWVLFPVQGIGISWYPRIDTPCVPSCRYFKSRRFP